MNDLVSLPARILRDRMAAGALTARETLEAFLARSESVNGAVNALVTIDSKSAREAADKADAAARDGRTLGPLHGLPVAVKDLQATAGMRTTYGSLIHSDFTPDRDDPSVARIRDAGAVVFAKSNTPEFGAGANTRNAVFGATGNPFSPELTCGGSSGGSAVALALDMAPLATGSDMGGSLRTPAAFCGVCGFRPTAGLVPAARQGSAWSHLSVEGPMARDVADLGLLLSSMAGSDSIDPFARASPWPDRAALASPAPVRLSDLRFGFSADLGFAPIDPAIAEVFTERMRIVSDGAAETNWAHPSLDGARDCFETLRAVGFETQLADAARDHRDQLGPNVLANLSVGDEMTLRDVANATRVQSDIFHSFHAFFDQVDALICPTASVSPFPHAEWYPKRVGDRTMPTYIEWIGITYGVTLSGHPVAAIPCGFDHAGMPFGVQVIGRFANDARTLSIAAALEAEFQLHPKSRRPVPQL